MKVTDEDVHDNKELSELIKNIIKSGITTTIVAAVGNPLY